MSDVLIRGMEMPTEGTVIAIYKLYDKFYASVHGTELCPLVPVPPHGDLIDRDALMQEFYKAENTMEQHGQEYACSFLSTSQELSTEWYCVEDIVDNAPTVIEASEVE